MSIPLQTLLTRLTRREPRVVADATVEWRHAAVAAIFRDGLEGAELLYIQRAEHELDPWSGQVGFPGGRAEPTDESLEHTAARETREELGLELMNGGVRRLGALDQLQARARRKILPMAITPYAFVLEGERPALAPNYEVDAAFWVPLGHLVDPDRQRWYDASRAKVPYRFRAIDLGQKGTPLWGLTHYMTMEILHRLDLVDDVDELTTPRGTG